MSGTPANRRASTALAHEHDGYLFGDRLPAIYWPFRFSQFVCVRAFEFATRKSALP
jgi:hypothetical protein